MSANGDPKDRTTVKLREAVEELYTAFAPCPLKERMDVCPCGCVDQWDAESLYRRPLRQLTGDALAKYAFKAMTTWGDVDDLRHFLPRLLELQAFGWSSSPGVEQLLSKLAYGEWRTWPRSEQAAIERYLTALWEHALATTEVIGDWGTEFDSYLCGIGQAMDDLSTFLRAWQASDEVLAIQNLAEFLRTNLEAIVERGVLGNPWWEERQAQMLQALAWLRDPSLLELCRSRLASCTDVAAQEALRKTCAFLSYISRPMTGDQGPLRGWARLVAWWRHGPGRRH